MTDTTNNWGSYTGGSSFSTGTRRYLKKTFSGANKIAAFEMSASYRHGIVVYVNGHEVYRDHVEEGPIYAFTQFTQPYSSQDFHSFIRSAYHITNGSDNVVAVMLLLPNGYQVTFDAWLALYSPSPIYTAYNAMWYGMVKTLVSPEWFVWEEAENVPAETYRVHIGRKIDKYCR